MVIAEMVFNVMELELFVALTYVNVIHHFIIHVKQLVVSNEKNMNFILNLFVCFCSIEPNRHFAYEGETCQVPENCIEHANCHEQKCRCDNGYTAKNGVCCM